MKSETKSIEEKVARYERVFRLCHDLQNPAGEIIGLFAKAIMAYMDQEYDKGDSANARFDLLIQYFDSFQSLLLFVEHEFHDELPRGTSPYIDWFAGKKVRNNDLS